MYRLTSGYVEKRSSELPVNPAPTAARGLQPVVWTVISE
jgi:hypothetical protein